MGHKSISRLRCTNLIHWTGIRADADLNKRIGYRSDTSTPLKFSCECYYKIHCLCCQLHLSHSRLQTGVYTVWFTGFKKGQRAVVSDQEAGQ